MLFILGLDSGGQDMQGAFNVDWDKTLDDKALDEETSRLYRKEVAEASIAMRPKKKKRVTRDKRRRAGRGGRAGMAVTRDTQDAQVSGGRQSRYRSRGSSDDDEEEQEDEEDEEDEEGEEGEDEPDGEEEQEEEDSDAPGPPRRPARRRRRRHKAKSPERKIPEPHPPSLRFETSRRRFFVMDNAHEPRPGRYGHYLKPYTVDDEQECVPFPAPPEYDANEQKKTDKRVIQAGWPGQPWPDKSIVEYVQRKWEEYKRIWIALDERPRLEEMAKRAGWGMSFIKYYISAMVEIGRANAPVPFMISRKVYMDSQYDKELFHPGHGKMRDPGLPPNSDWCVEGIHFVGCNSPLEDHSPSYYEIGPEFLKQCVERGEKLDFEFARRMQGLLGVGQDAVWACLDPDFNPADREGALERFTGSYSAGFYKSVTWEDQQDPRGVAIEALQQHKAFCQVRIQKRTGSTQMHVGEIGRDNFKVTTFQF